MKRRLILPASVLGTLALALGVVGVFVVPGVTHAAPPILVTNCASETGAGSIGAAITTANSTPGADIINVTCTGTIPITTTLDVTDDLTINGNSVTLDGGGTTQVFQIGGGVTLTVTLNQLTIAHGSSSLVAGGINSSNTNLTINSGTFTDNATSEFAGAGGGAIASSGGSLTITGSTFTGNTAHGVVGGHGGAISSDGGDLSITTSVFTQNTATGMGSGSIVGGGAIAFTSSGANTFTLSQSTFSGNSLGIADISNGGALYLAPGGPNATPTALVSGSTFTGNTTGVDEAGAGGAIYAAIPTTVANSTITGNSAHAGIGLSALGGGIANYASTLTLLNDTIVGNTTSGSAGSTSAGSDLSGAATAKNTIVAAGSGAANCSGPITDGGHNLDDGTSCGFAAASSNKNPQLGALANNGGLTQTKALLSGSPAINAGDDAICAAAPVNGLDQRGVTRPQDTHCDIGAYEAVPGIPTLTLLTASASSLTCGQNVTLTATVGLGPVTPPGPPTGTVTFKDGSTTLGTAPLSSSKATLTINTLGNGAHTITAIYSGTSTTGTTPGFTGSTSTTVTVTVTGCQGLDGLGSAPVAPQKPQAPQRPQAPQQPQAPAQPQVPSMGSTTANGATSGNTVDTTLTQQSQTAPSGQNVQHTSGLPVLPLALFAALLVLLGLGGLSARLVTRRRSAES
jgi:hypothetical protein